MPILRETVTVNAATWTKPVVPATSKFLRVKNTVSGAGDILVRTDENDVGTEDPLPAGTWYDFDQFNRPELLKDSTPFAFKGGATHDIKLEYVY